MDQESKIFVAGHRGLVGSHIYEELLIQGYKNIIIKDRQDLELRDQQAVLGFFEAEAPEYVFLAAAKVGGIGANSAYPADFIMDNLQIQCNVIDAAFKTGVEKLLFLGSSCIYPKMCPQPIKEEYLLTGELEPTNEAYALAKIAGLKMCEFYKKQYGANFISIMPTNLYGPRDSFDLNNSHVLPALLRKMHEAKVNGEKEVEIWGTGQALREFLYVEDMAKASIFAMQHYEGIETLNVGTGQEVSIGELAELIKEVVGFKGELRFNPDRPDGTPRKLLDVSKMSQLGWKYEVELKEGIEKTYNWYLEHEKEIKK